MWWVSLVLTGTLCHASTHWTRADGKIVAQRHQSFFAMKQPYAFMDLFEQEKILQDFEATTKEMEQLHATLKNRMKADEQLEHTITKQDVDCGPATLDLTVEYFSTPYAPFFLSNFADHADMEIQAHPPFRISVEDVWMEETGPVCHSFFSLPYSPYAFEHLESMQNRETLEMNGVGGVFTDSLISFLSLHASVDFDPDIHNIQDYVVSVERRLTYRAVPLVLMSQLRNDKMNEMVTVHSLSAAYWMHKGNAPNAMECMRSALHLANSHKLMHHSNLDWRGMILMQFGNLLTLTQQYEDAIIVLELARQYSRTLTQRTLAMLALADTYALTANFTMAVPLYKEGYDNLKTSENFAVIGFFDKFFDPTGIPKKIESLNCNSNLRIQLEQQYDNLKEYILEGEKYISGNERTAAIARQAKARRADRKRVAEDSLIYDQAVYGWNPYRDCRVVTEGKTKRARLTCALVNEKAYDRTMRPQRDLSIDAVPFRYLSSQRNKTVWRQAPIFTRDRHFAANIEKFANAIVDEPQIPAKYPLSKSMLEEADPYWRRADWPSAGECDAVLFHSDHSRIDSIPQLFVTPEQKGFIVSDLLTRFMGLESTGEHPLPWEEPTCASTLPTTKFLQLQGVNRTLRVKRADKWRESELKGTLVRLAERKLHEAEIGQRINTLIHHNIGPKWISHNLAALYWRVVGFPGEAMRCLLHAVESTSEYKDVALFQMAQVVMRTTQLRQEAELLFHLAATAAPLQPQSHFMLARVHLLANQVDQAVTRLKDALDRDPFDSLAANDLLSVVCRGQPSKPAVRSLFPSICCSPAVQNAVCFKGGRGENCYVLERDPITAKHSFVYNRCNRVYTGSSYKPYPIVSLLSPFLPIFNTLPKAEKKYNLDEPEGVQTIHTPEITLDDGGSDPYFNHRAPDWYHSAKREIVYSSTDRKDEFEMSVDYQQPRIPDKPLSLLWVSKKSEMLGFDVPLPEVLPKPSMDLVRVGLAKFPIPRASPSSCSGVQRMEPLLDSQVSTYLSVSAKGANVEKYIDVHSPMPRGGPSLLPDCPSPQQSSPFLLLDHLPFNALSDQFLFYKPEKALTDALLAIGRRETVDGMGMRLGQAMRMAHMRGDEGEMWLPAVVAALYWRVRGDAQMAVGCLRLALAHAPPDMRDVALVSLANVCHQAGLLHSALITAGAALDVSPNLVAIHFTIANIYASIGDYGAALEFYYSTIALQSSLDTAKARIRAIYCYNAGEKYNMHLLI